MFWGVGGGQGGDFEERDTGGLWKKRSVRGIQEDWRKRDLVRGIQEDWGKEIR